MSLTPTTPIAPSFTLAQAAAAAASFGAALRAQFVERDAEVASLLRAVVAQEHVLLLGPPGTAKSALTLAFAEGLGWTSFVRLMGKTTVPEELFGPYSLTALEQDRFERQIGGYLPTSQVAFLDEALALDTPVPTPSGWTTMGALSAGDAVLGSDGRPTRVLRVTEIATDHQCYRVHFRDGTSIVADAGHNWSSRPARHKPGTPFRVRTTGQMANSGQAFQVPLPAPVEFPEAVLPIDPYALGIWLGNGNCWNGEVYIRPEWVARTIGELSAVGLVATDGGPTNERETMHAVRLSGTGFRTALGDLGLLGGDRSAYTGSHKRVPAAYLRGSVRQRQRLLQGLMDTDGWTDGATCVFSNTNESLVDAVVEIARSFGWPTTKGLTKDERIGMNGPHRPCWKVTFRADPSLSPFLARPVEIAPLAQERAMLIHRIEPVESVPVRCIEVDAADHLFLAGRGFTVTHNCFKANSAVLNGLLTALNERAFDQGTTRIGIPLEVCVGASNEMPQDDGLAALYDRFLIRHWVAYVRDDAAFARMLLSAGPTAPARLDPEAVRVLRDAARAVDVSKVLGSIVKIRAELAEKHAIVVSDRRWRKALGVVRAAAALDGRTRATGRDLECLVDVLWDRVEQRDPIRAVVMRNRNPDLVIAQRLHGVAADVVAGLRKVDGDLSRLDMGGVARVTGAIGEIAKVLGEMRAILGAESDPEVAEEIAKVRALGVELQSAVRAAQERFRL